MPENVTSNFQASVSGNVAEALAISGVSFNLQAPAVSMVLSNGSVASCADNLWGDVRVIANGTNEVINVATLNGSLDGIGNSLSLKRVKLLWVHNANQVETTINQNNSISVGGSIPGAWTAAFTGTVTVPGGGFMMLGAAGTNPFPILSSSGSLVRISNTSTGTTSSQYEIVVLGSSEWGTTRP